jgi:hypothetical protein
MWRGSAAGSKKLTTSLKNGPTVSPILLRMDMDPGHHNRNETNWRTKGGHYGHCHVPVNDHWDPAYTKEETDFVMSFTPVEGMKLVAEKAQLPSMGRKVAAVRRTPKKTKTA